MSCQRTQKVVMRFPFVQNDGTISNFAVPQRSRVLIDSTAGFSDPDPLSPASILGGQRLSLPVDGLTGIGLAPDSAIDCADISIVGVDDDSNRFRISAGNPALGLSMNDRSYVTVSLPKPIPGIAVSSQNYMWDGYQVNYGPGLIWGVPLRLELYYGGLVPQRVSRRAPMHASWRVRNASASTVSGMFAYVEGRRHIQFTAFNLNSSTISLRVFAWDNQPATTNAGRLDGSAQVATNIVPSTPLVSGVPLIINLFAGGGSNGDQDINPYRIVNPQITDSASGTDTWLDVYAWD